MRILILGGAGLTGPHQVRYALARGHEVTLFNRGRTPLAPDLAPVEQLHGDRAAGELSALEGRSWDVCIDVPTSLPSWVRDAGRVLAGHVGHYIFVSTVSVYADLSTPPTETSSLHVYEGADAYAETMDSLRASAFQLYGPLKARSEQEAVAQFGADSTTIVRPGLIVGPGDNTDRFSYWPLRVRRGGEVLAPGAPQDPTQVIDARDIGEWVVRLAEQRAVGVFNATGPAQPLPFGEMLERLRAQLNPDAHFTWVPADFLQAQQVAPWMDMPAWVPADGEAAGMMRADITRALASGLTFRPLEQTVADLVAWFDALPEERRGALRAGLSAEREKAVLEAWRVR